MRAAWYNNFGPANEVLQTGKLETPIKEKSHILVQMSCSGVNPVDIARRNGSRGEMTDPLVIPHFDGAGIVEDTGERVWLYESQWKRAQGTAAEYISIPAHLANPLPDTTTFEEGACLGIPAMTAHRCVYGDGPVKNQWILITGGAGAVGNYAIQFAKLGGAKIITTVSTDKKEEIAKNSGADHIINYKHQDVPSMVQQITNDSGVDRVIEVEFGRNLSTNISILKINGVIATYASSHLPEPLLPFYQLMYKGITVRHELVFIMPPEAKKLATTDIHRWLEKGAIKHNVGSIFELEDIVSAHENVEKGSVGKTIIRINDSN